LEKGFIIHKLPSHLIAISNSLQLKWIFTNPAEFRAILQKIKCPAALTANLA